MLLADILSPWNLDEFLAFHKFQQIKDGSSCMQNFEDLLKLLIYHSRVHLFLQSISKSHNPSGNSYALQTSCANIPNENKCWIDSSDGCRQHWHLEGKRKPQPSMMSSVGNILFQALQIMKEKLNGSLFNQLLEKHTWGSFLCLTMSQEDLIVKEPLASKHHLDLSMQSCRPVSCSSSIITR